MNEATNKKHPDTMDGDVWASRLQAWFGTFRVPADRDALAEWFNAALKHGYDKGLLDQAKNHAEAAARERVDVPPPLRPVYPKWLDHANVDELRAFMKRVETLPAFPPERLGDMDKRIAKLEDEIVPEHWHWIAASRDALHALEHRVKDLEPADEDGPGYDERLEKLETIVLSGGLGEQPGLKNWTAGTEDLSVRCARAELRVAELEKLLDHEKKTNRMVGEAYMRPRDREEKLKVAVEKWAKRSMPLAGERGGWWSRELKEDLG